MGLATIAAQEDNPSVEFASLLPAADATKDQKKPDHAFVIVGRDVNSDSHDFNTWNDDAIALDTHARDIYPKSLLKEKMDLIPRFSAGSTNVGIRARVNENTAQKLPVRFNNILTDRTEVAHFLVDYGYVYDPRTAEGSRPTA